MLNFPPYSAALPKQLSWHNLVPKVSRLQSLFLAIACTIDAILTDIANVFHIWASLAGESARDLSQSETEKYFKWISTCLYAQIDCSVKYLLGRTERTYMLKGNTLVFRCIKRHGVGTEYCACKYVIDRVLITGSHFFIYECMFTQLWKYAYQKFAWDACQRREYPKNSWPATLLCYFSAAWQVIARYIVFCFKAISGTGNHFNNF